MFTELDESEAGSFRLRSYNRLQCGWPALCLEGAWRDADDLAKPETAWLLSLPRWIGPLELPIPTAPLKPLWIGLTINTAVYGAAFWMLGATFHAWRRRDRLCRNRCYACGYDLSGVPGEGDLTCSECGEVIASRWLTSRKRPVPRLWMLPLALPIVALAAASFFSLIDWSWLRIQILYNTPILTARWLLPWLAAMLFTFVLAVRAYDDRSGRERVVLAAIASFVLVTASFLSTYVLLVGRSP